MAPSTSPAGTAEAEARFGVATLERFYRWHAPLYDWTRPFILYGRRQMLEALPIRPGAQVLDIGCGTGWGSAALARRGARVTGIECSRPMLAQARRRMARLGLPADVVRFDDRPYGSHGDFEDGADIALFSYSLSMIVPWDEALAQVRRDLRRGGLLAVVDFLDATRPASVWLGANHVSLGPERLERLRALCPAARVAIHSVGAWRYFLFSGTIA